jgi:putative ABC transport system substrate-binding protein
MSCGPSIPDILQRAASYGGRILKGAKPADSPVERPTRFDLVVDLKTVPAPGLNTPLSVLKLSPRI